MNIALIRQEIRDEIGLLEMMSEILDGISNKKLQAVSRSRMERVQMGNIYPRKHLD
jgi:hypothetical protein